MNLLERTDMQTQCRAIQWIVIGIAIGILAVVAFTGCGTLTGVMDDTEDLITHARTHVQ